MTTIKNNPMVKTLAALAAVGILVFCSAAFAGTGYGGNGNDGYGYGGNGYFVPAHLKAAVELVTHVRSADSSYEHKRGIVRWRGSGGAPRYVCHTDCSGLVNHLFEHCYGLSDRDLWSWLGSGRPKADTYHRAIMDQNGFQHITRLDQVRPGDIIAVKYPRGSGDTGHTMIVDRMPVPRRSTAPRVRGTQQWEIGIIDSSKSGHGKSDSRRRPGGKYKGGIGAGVLRLYTDRQGTIVGHSWSTAGRSKFRGQRGRHLAIGRLRS